MPSLEAPQAARGALDQGWRRVTPACRKMLIGTYEIGTARRRVEPLGEEAFRIDQVMADDENALADWRGGSVGHMDEGLLAAQRLEQPDRLTVAAQHRSIGQGRSEA